MSDVHTLLTRCRELGAEFTPTPDGKLKVRAPAPLPEGLQEQLRQRKAEVLALLTRPYLNDRGELIIPFGADPRYRWWLGGQSIAATLAELDAPPDVWRRYVGTRTRKRCSEEVTRCKTNSSRSASSTRA
jgi:hypothetical protein